MKKITNWHGIINEYRYFIEISEDAPAVTLLEGNTPLVPSVNLSEEMNCEVWFKIEGANPTGSFKDRGMTVAVSQALYENANAVACASTGNTAASAAAYAARAGIKCLVIIPEGKIALGKLAQALAHGAHVIALDGNFDQALEIVRSITSTHEIALVNSLNPYRIEGQKTAAFEIVDKLEDAPDFVFIPVGNAGNITAYWRGFTQYYEHGEARTLPKMVGWQAAGAAPIVLGHRVDNPETFATAIRIGNPARWKEAEQAAKASGGFIGMVTDDEIRAAYEYLAQEEGIFCEPASAASVAGLRKAFREGAVPKDSRVVCILTGHGLKDPDSAVEFAKDRIMRLEADRARVEAYLEEELEIGKRQS